MTDSEIKICHPFAWNLINGLEKYYIPVLIVFGSFGNCLSVYVIFATKMRLTPSNFYLAALALSDTGFLMALFLAWLGVININLINQQGFCQFFVYITNVFSFLSAWFVVAFTVDRFIAVCYPLRRQWMCTVNRAKILIRCVIGASLLLCSPVFLYSQSILNEDDSCEVCSISKGWEKIASVLNIMDTILTFVIPFLVIITFNSLIIKSIWQVNSVVSSLKAHVSTNDSSSAAHQARITKMLLVVSSVFFCLNLPAYAMRIYVYLQAKDTATELEYLIQKVCNLLFDTNFGINFGLYCASGQNFRLAVAQQFHCLQQHPIANEQLQKSTTKQTIQRGTETIRKSGMTSLGHVFFDKPWEDSLQLHPYPGSQRADEDADDTNEIRHLEI